MAKRKELNDNIEAEKIITTAEPNTAAEDLTVAADEPTIVVEEPVTAAVRKGIVNCDDLRLRDEPNLDSNIIKLLPKGTEIVIIDNANSEFYKLADGYVMKKFVDEK